MNDTARIIVNIGAPDAPTPESASKFLAEFLSDKRVISTPLPLRKILAFVISRKRCRNYARELSQIFADGKHPLKKFTESLAQKVAKIDGNPVEVAYRYGTDSIPEVVERLKKRGAKRFLFVPLYPQHTRSTIESATAKIRRTLKRGQYRIAKAYFDDHDYISALASTIPSKCQTLIVSFHSVPLEHAKNSPYQSQCRRTAELLAKYLGIKRVELAWQSQMPKGEWLTPTTREVAENLIAHGEKHAVVIAPSFACDCSETLRELGGTLAAQWKAAGGESLFVCRCLNDSDAHARLIAKLFKNLESIL